MADESRQQAFDREFRKHIERFTRPLIDALHAIAIAPVPPVVKLVAFEMRADWRSFPVYAFAMDDESPDEVCFEPPFSGYVLPNVGELIPRGAIDQDGYEQAGVNTVESWAEILAEWFGECWHAAGGARLPIRAVISLHDSSRYFDLGTRCWIRDVDIWPS